MALRLHKSVLGAAAALQAPSARLLLCHATGFCGAVFQPYLAALDSHAKRAGLTLEAYTFDFSGHGENRDRAAEARDWGTWCSRDVLEAVAGLSGAAPHAPGGGKHPTQHVHGAHAAADGVPTIAIGHSMGGAAAVLAEIRAPGTFAHIVAFEPIIFPVAGMRAADGFDASPLATGAERRRATWASAAAARRYLAAKPLFGAWQAAALDGYLQGGLAPAGKADIEAAEAAQSAHHHAPRSTHGHHEKGHTDKGHHTAAAGGDRHGAGGVLTVGHAVTLACRPGFEADVYRGFHNAWDHLGSIACPVDVVAGATSTHMSRFGPAHDTLKGIAKRLPHGTMSIVPDASHFLVMEKPAECATLTASLLHWPTLK